MLFSTTRLGDSRNYGDSLRQNFSDLNLSEDSRGKFYEKYMKKRNAKLQEDWSMNRVEEMKKCEEPMREKEREEFDLKIALEVSKNLFCTK